MPFRLLILSGLIACFLVLQGFAQTNDAENNINLTADTLVSTLYAKTNAEKEYCENIVRLRDEKILPNRIFYGVYRKSVTLEKKRRFIYFQTGLEILCKREGIVLESSASPNKPNHIFSTTPTKSTITVSQNTSTTTEKQSPFSFIQKLYRNWYSR
ncbi:MAG: hypothetical protein LBE12_05955 [Planctomycetaceae bacterium]|jgi:hypothetical protein|nr:hypothetical protein [Planctomycetaceae bacterium]